MCSMNSKAIILSLRKTQEARRNTFRRMGKRAKYKQYLEAES